MICIFFSACSKPEDLTFPKELNNKKTSAHTDVPGTNMSIILPNCLNSYPVDRQAYFGRIKNDSCGLIFREDNRMNYYQFQEGFKEQFKQANFLIEEETHLKINNFPAIAFFVHKDRENGYYLIFGDSTFVAYAMSVQQNSSLKLRKQIFKSLITLCYDKNTKIPNSE